MYLTTIYLIKGKLSKSTAHVVRNNLILKNSNKRIDSGNIDYPYDLHILHKMREETNSALDLDKNDCIDLFKLFEYLKCCPPNEKASYHSSKPAQTI